MTQPRKQIFSIQLSSQPTSTEVDEMAYDAQENYNKEIWNVKSFMRSFLTIDFERHSSGFSALNSIKAITFVVFLHTIYLMVPNQDVVIYPAYWPELILSTINWAVVSIFFHYFDYLLIMSKHDAFSAIALLYSN